MLTGINNIGLTITLNPFSDIPSNGKIIISFPADSF
jgi:hypothetical protein